MAMGAFDGPIQDHIQARGISIVDPQNGRQRIDIRVNNGNGDAYVAVKDLEAREHMTLVGTWNGDVTFVRIMDNQGKVRTDWGLNQRQPFRNP